LSIELRISKGFKKYTSSAIYKAIVKRVEKMVVVVIKKGK
jgi:Ribonuclease G/E